MEEMPKAAGRGAKGGAGGTGHSCLFKVHFLETPLQEWQQVNIPKPSFLVSKWVLN